MISIFTICIWHQILVGQSCQGEWNGHVPPQMTEMKIKDTQKLLLGKPEENVPFGRTRYQWVHSSKTNLKKQVPGLWIRFNRFMRGYSGKPCKHGKEHSGLQKVLNLLKS